jgi:rhodanese-related sulfurtransferase
MKKFIKVIVSSVLGWGMVTWVYAAEVTVASLEMPGRLDWASSSLNVTCRVEWASSPDGPWYSTWTNQQAVVVATPSNQSWVAMCYRVVCDIPNPHFPDITATQGLDLMMHRVSDTGFEVIDVRTGGEYDNLHVVGANNVDYYGADFVDRLDAFDKDKAYLIYCASGYRSGRAHDTMLGLGFREVYNMLGGMAAFQIVPGADVFLATGP